MIDYPAARAVALVAQTGSFDGAAAALGVTASAVSQRVRQIEERLGAVLIERGAPCRATPQGAALCRHMERVGLMERTLFRELPGGAGASTGAAPVTLSLAVNADSLATWALAALAPFSQSEGYLIHLTVEDETETAQALRAGRVLAAVTATQRPVQGCEVTPLGAMRYHATASPDFLRRYFPQGVTEAAMARAPGLTFSQKDGLQQDWLRAEFGHSLSYPTHFLPSSQSFVEACVMGMGWALNPAPMVADHLAAGRLVELIPGAVMERPLYWQVNRLAAEELAPLSRAMTEAARASMG